MALLDGPFSWPLNFRYTPDNPRVQFHNYQSPLKGSGQTALLFFFFILSAFQLVWVVCRTLLRDGPPKVFRTVDG